jgi:uncharacterized protein with von Willebrand factor type A (vWA) domain
MTAAAAGLFRGVDRALFAAAFTDVLRSAGLTVAGGDGQVLAQSLAAVAPQTVEDLYWVCRLSTVRTADQVDRFDQEFALIFGTHARAAGPAAVVDRPSPNEGDRHRSLRTLVDGMAVHGAGLPWLDSTPSVEPDLATDDDSDDDPLDLAEPAPSPDDPLATTPFDLLDPARLAELGERIEQLVGEWPTRRTRRTRPASRGRPDLRRTMARARRTGGHPVDLAVRAPGRRPRPVVALLDVSGSMEPYARAYLHLLRALARLPHRSARTEVFAFGTDLTRLTPALRLRSVDAALTRAEELVTDRFGGTRIATSLGRLLNDRVWGSTARGAVVLVVSDGWDTDDPDLLRRRVAALARRSHRLVWVNPRVAGPDYTADVRGMAAARPHCEVVLSGHNLVALDKVIDALVG